ncbi:MAG: SGNH/GDSL hydrolase family protein, partial [Candidatus Delongbacteria bacterium]|nr:SGNH/GDSL hydrolase family protein [Candidatus Delongbacteria bacterium]
MKPKYPIYFYLIALVFPLIILIMVELGLRYFGYGMDRRPWVPVSSDYPEWLTLNPEFTRPYFQRLQRIPTPHFSFFRDRKPINSFRVFVLGESSTAGFPYDANVSFPDFLARRLQSLYPQSRIEMVNLGISAINSYTLLDILPAVLDRQPDLILIYTGHNEYYGAWGAGSSETLGRFPQLVTWWKAFNRLKITEWGHQIIRTFHSRNEAGTTLMERMVGDPSIAIDSRVYRMGVNQFERNMSQMIEMIQQYKVPLLIGNLVSNLKDQPPLASMPLTGREKNPVSDGGEPASADESFRAAQSAEQAGDYSRARSLYVQARDLDAMRFRAPSEFNAIIDSLCRDHHIPMVDLDSAFSANSPNGLIGNELMTDHLHPTREGYRLMADVFRESMNRSGYLPATPIDSLAPEPPIPFTGLDSMIAVYRLAVLKSSWPFTDRISDRPVNLPIRSLIDSLAYKVVGESYSFEKAHLKAAEYWYSQARYPEFCREMETLIAYT